MNLEAFSLSELKALLAKVDADIAAADSEAAICNDIAKRFTGLSTYSKSDYNKKLKMDIQIQLDILDFINSGNTIKIIGGNGRLNSKAVRGAKAGKRLYNKFAV